MKRINKKKLDEKARDEVIKQFAFIVGDVAPYNSAKFCREFFTEAELLAYAKRMGIIYMIAANASFRQISWALKVNLNVVEEVHVDFIHGNLDTVRMVLMKKKPREAFWKDMKPLLESGIPDRGRHRWAWLDDVL